MLGEEKLRNLLQIIEDSDVDIACICETWFDSQEGKFTAVIKEAGYDIKHANREKKRGGGVALIYKRKLNMKPGEASTTKYVSFEFSYCILKTIEAKILVVCVYRLQEISVQIFCEEFETFMDTIFHKGDKIIITGDFNVWIEQNNSDAGRLTNMMNGYGLSQRVNKSTHIEGHTLDHVYVNECQLELNCEVGDRRDLSTDHYPITFSIPSNENRSDGEIIRYRDKQNLDIDLLKSELQEAFEKIDFGDGGSFVYIIPLI